MLCEYTAFTTDLFQGTGYLGTCLQQYFTVFHRISGNTSAAVFHRISGNTSAAVFYSISQDIWEHVCSSISQYFTGYLGTRLQQYFTVFHKISGNTSAAVFHICLTYLVEVVPVHATMAYRSVEVLLRSFLTSTVDGGD